jgi:mRNA-degrading endonuclease RelE of RelBE toxin-antitoxin system
MSLRIRFTETAKNSFHSLHIDSQKEIKSSLKKLASGEIKGKELTAQLYGLLSLKVSNYRIIYRKFLAEIIVYDVGHRSNIYKDFKEN